MEAVTSATGRKNKLKQRVLVASSPPLQQTSKHTHTHTMPRAKNSLVAEGPVSVHKVEKIEPVYYNNLVTRPSVFANPGVVTVLTRLPSGAGVSVSGQKKVFQRALSEREVISDYIATKKRQFAGEIPQGGTSYT